MSKNEPIDMIIVLKGFSVGDSSSVQAEGLTKKEGLRKCIENGIRGAGCDFVHMELVDAELDTPDPVELVLPERFK